MSAYCGTCRINLVVEENPPYSVVHRIEPDGSTTHHHPITGETLLTETTE